MIDWWWWVAGGLAWTVIALGIGTLIGRGIRLADIRDRRDRAAPAEDIDPEGPKP